jgi:hypothetical protein
MPLDTTNPATEFPSTAAKQCPPDSTVARRAATSRLLPCSFLCERRLASVYCVTETELKNEVRVCLPGRRKRGVSGRRRAASGAGGRSPRTRAPRGGGREGSGRRGRGARASGGRRGTAGGVRRGGAAASRRGAEPGRRWGRPLVSCFEFEPSGGWRRCYRLSDNVTRQYGIVFLDWSLDCREITRR